MTTATSQQAVIRAGLQALFATGIFNVTFIKSDGILRTLKVTTDTDRLPLDVMPSETKVSRAVNEANATVFDLDAQAWKSFKIDSLISISAVFE